MRLQAQLAAGFIIPTQRKVFMSAGTASDKKDLFKSVQLLLAMQYTLFATAGTAAFLNDCGVPIASITVVAKVRADGRQRACFLLSVPSV